MTDDNQSSGVSQRGGEKDPRAAVRRRWWIVVRTVLTLAESLAVSKEDTALAWSARAVRIVGDVVVSLQAH